MWIPGAGMASLNFADVNFGLLGAMSLGKFIALVVAACFAMLTSTKSNRLGKAGIYGIAATQSNDLAFGLVLVEALHKEFVPYLFLIGAAAPPAPPGARVGVDARSRPVTPPAAPQPRSSSRF